MLVPLDAGWRARRDEQADPPTLVCQVGSTKLGYQLRCIEDLHEMLRERGDRIDLGAADEQKPAEDDTVEAWARSPDCSKRWAWQRSSTTRGTIGCDRARGGPAGSARACG